MGGKSDGDKSRSTDSGVRVGLSVHSVQSAVGPATRSASDTSLRSNLKAPDTRFVATVTEIVCTLGTCLHCCACHLRHNRTGYGRCMRTARQPWPDCECAGKCAAGRCAQVECAGSRATVDLTRCQPSSHHGNCISPAVSFVSPHPAPSPSPPAGVRRTAGGVHVDEDVCASPQAGARASFAAAYRQPSAAVSDSRSAASVEVAAAESGRETMLCADKSEKDEALQCDEGVLRSNRAKAKGAQLPVQVLSCLSALPHTPHPLCVIADGRCSVASILLALGAIPDEHSSEADKRVIDAKRRRLGEALRDKWTEREWVQQVPVDLRGGARRPDAAAGHARRSYAVLQQLLLHGPATAWLDHCVLYVASALHDMAALVLYTEGDGQWYCRHVGRGQK